MMHSNDSFLRTVPFCLGDRDRRPGYWPTQYCYTSDSSGDGRMARERIKKKLVLIHLRPVRLASRLTSTL